MSECMDCGCDATSRQDQYYMLKNELWAQVNPQINGMLCIPCLERRLGRPTTDEDFSITPTEMNARLMELVDEIHNCLDAGGTVTMGGMPVQRLVKE